MVALKIGPFFCRVRCSVLIVAVAVATCGCDHRGTPLGDASATSSGDKTAASDSHARVRAERRAYDGAPPVIPHQPIGAACTNCHTETGLQFGEMGFAPPMPHTLDPYGGGRFSRCTQCHVFKESEELFRENAFVGLRQDLRHGKRLNEFAPPVMPHSVFMRENCLACHTGPAGRDEIRCDHPERVRCTQCHVQVVTNTEFQR